MTWLFNGCSFVENSHLELENSEWRGLYWPTLVHADHHNIAVSGASNTRIFRTTIDYIYSNNPEQIVIGWTGLDRQELPCANGDRVRLRSDCTSFENDQHSMQGHQTHLSWYQHHHNDWLAFEQLLHQILIVQDLARSRRIQCWMFNAFWHNYVAYPGQPLQSNFNVINQKHYHKHLQDLQHAKNLIAQINFDHWIWPPKVTLSQWVQQQKLECESGGHPAASAQKSIADHVIFRTRRTAEIN